MSRCQRKIVAGVTISRIAVSRSMGSVPASSASHGPVRPRQTRMSTRPLTLGDSKLMAQHQDQVDQLQAHKPKIIPPRPARTFQPGAGHRTGPTCATQGICPGRIGFPHPQPWRCPSASSSAQHLADQLDQSQHTSGACPPGLITTVFPAAMADAVFLLKRRGGQLNAGIATTP
jgi:hypothetical protein